MNIFYIDEDPKEAAEMLCDKHVVKMILESAQMLCTAHRVLDGDTHADLIGLYKSTHKNHPCSVWTRSSIANYMWLYSHMLALMTEYTYRYNKHHATERLIELLKKPPIVLVETEYKKFAPPPQCMPDHCKNDDTVKAYRKYYISEKADIARWKSRIIPYWFTTVRPDKLKDSFREDRMSFWNEAKNS